MSFFQKLKKNIGIEEEAKEKEIREKPKEQKKKKRGRPQKKREEVIEDTPIEEKLLPREKSLPEKKVSVSTQNKKPTSDWVKAEGQLAVDVYQTETEFFVQAPIAGVTPEDIEVTVENEMLVIKGERQEPKKDEEKNYFYQECYWGPFQRQIILPEDVDIQRIKATLRKGILTVKIPRVRRIKKKKITIQTEE